MKIQFIPQVKLYNKFYSTTKQEHNNIKNNYSYNPISYQDFNISFGERLFRTPEDFYSQDFNEKGMPKMLHEYVYDSVDSAFKKTIPPAQAMKEVYGALKFAQNLDMVKQIYPQEPLFNDCIFLLYADLDRYLG